MTASFHKEGRFGPVILVELHHFLSKCLYQARERSCICMLGVSILPLSMILALDFETVPTVWYFLFCIF